MFRGSYTEAKQRLERMINSGVEPEVSNAEIDSLLEESQRGDRYGRAPSNADWQFTCDLDSAAARGWELKAGKCAHKYYFSASGQQYNGQQQRENCESMARLYLKRVHSSAPVMSRSSRHDRGEMARHY